MTLFLAFSALLAAQSVTTPPTLPPDQSTDIVVTAAKELEAKAATHFVRGISVTTQGQLAKFRAPVCPVAIGFTADIAMQIADRIRQIASDVGVPVAEPGCAGNIVLLATVDGRALIKELRARHPMMLDGLEPYQIDRLIKRPGPVRAWNVTAVENEDGRRPGGGPGTSQGEYRTLEVRSGSVFHPQNQQTIDLSTIIVDSPAVVGKSVTQLADYAAMRALARTRPIEDGAVDTILGLFGADAKDAPAAMTVSDRIYLKTLYETPGNRSSTSLVGRISKKVRKGKVE